MRHLYTTALAASLAAASWMAPSAAPAADNVAVAPANQIVGNAPEVARGRILVLPFTSVGSADSDAWIGRSVQLSLVADLSTSSPDRVISSDVPALDTAAALAAGAKDGARYVVVGNFHSAKPDLRITGQVLDVATGQTVAGLKATGTVANVFPMEDGLALQVKQRLMPEAVAAEQAGPARSAPAPQVEVQAPAPRADEYSTGVDTGPEAPGAYIAQPYSSSYESYSPTYTAPSSTYYSPGAYSYSAPYPYDYYAGGYGYPYYYYDYPFYGGLCFYGGGFYHHHDWDHDRDWDRGHGGDRGHGWDGGSFHGSSAFHGGGSAGFSSGGHGFVGAGARGGTMGHTGGFSHSSGSGHFGGGSAGGHISGGGGHGGGGGHR